jgi:penicillin-binding protein 1A
MACAFLAGLAGAVGLGAWVLYGLYADRGPVPDLGPLLRFEFPTIGHVYDAQGQPLIELAREQRQITAYEDIPPVVRDAILAAEDSRFFSHHGVDYLSLPRVLGKLRLNVSGRPMFPQGGSTITQQLVRGVFLPDRMALERGGALSSDGLAARALAWAIGPRNVNMLLRKREEIRLTVRVEARMRDHFGSTRLAKEAIFARYASFVYMGKGQYGFARAAEYYYGRPLSTLTTADAGLAASLAGIMKAPRDYAPTAGETERLLRRRNQVLALMGARGALTPDAVAAAQQRPLQPVVPRAVPAVQASGVIQHVLEELTVSHPDLGIEDLLQGDIQVHATVDARVQRIASDALEQGLDAYERRHPRARGLVQGSIVVLQNRDGSVLAEVGGRQVYRERAASYSDFNRVGQSRRQPGSAMKPLVYLAAFQHGGFTLETWVPDEPISVPDGGAGELKWIRNYDGQFKGPMPAREALAQSRNAVAIWITDRIGIDAVLATSTGLGVETPLQRYATTALGASEVTLIELATAYRTIASGLLAPPRVIRQIVGRSGTAIGRNPPSPVPAPFDPAALALVREGLRGVVRMPSGTAHALAARSFPIAVMGKTGTTSEFRDALFVGSTYGPDGITVAVRIGFDDNRSLGPGETGSRVALPVFRDVMLAVYRDGLVGPAPPFPPQIEAGITTYLQRPPMVFASATIAEDDPPDPSAGLQERHPEP